MPSTHSDDLKPELRDAVNTLLADLRNSNVDITLQARRTDSGKVKLTCIIGRKQMDPRIFEDNEQMVDKICEYLESARNVPGSNESN